LFSFSTGFTRGYKTVAPLGHKRDQVQ
jgi:hypothetical protein